MGLLNTMMNFRAKSQEQAATRAQKQAEAAHAQKLRELEAQRKIRPLIEDAYKSLGEDPGQLKKAIGDIFQAYQLETGTQVSDEVVKALSEPDFGAALLDASREAGATLGEIFRGGGQPLLRAEARIALANRAKALETQRALTGDAPAPQSGGVAEEQTPTPAPAATVTPGQPAGGAASPAASAAPGPQIDPRLKPAVDAIDAQIGALDQRRSIAIRANATPQQVAPLDQQLKDLRERRAKLVEGPLSTRVEAGIRREEEAAPPNVQSETGGAVLTRGEQEARRPALETPAARHTRETQTQHRETEAFRGLREVRERADTKVQTRPMVQLLAAELERAGPTGSITGPLREAIFNVAQLVKLDPKELSSIQTVNAASVFLAAQMLKDFSGPDSDRDFLNALKSQPSIRNVPEANRVIIQMALRDITLADDKRVNMNRWVAAFGSPSSVDPKTGKTFDETWNDAVQRIAPMVTKDQIEEWKKGPKRR